jgi:hypothetical protein
MPINACSLIWLFKLIVLFGSRDVQLRFKTGKNMEHNFSFLEKRKNKTIYRKKRTKHGRRKSATKYLAQLRIR